MFSVHRTKRNALCSDCSTTDTILRTNKTGDFCRASAGGNDAGGQQSPDVLRYQLEQGVTGDAY